MSAADPSMPPWIVHGQERRDASRAPDAPTRPGDTSRLSDPAHRPGAPSRRTLYRWDGELIECAGTRSKRAAAVRRQWPCAISVSPPLFRDRARKPCTIEGGMLGPAPPAWADTVLRYGCVLTVAVCHSRCRRASSIVPSRTQLLIGKLASCVWDGRAAGARFWPGPSHGS
jgi:hypothetical protein